LTNFKSLHVTHVAAPALVGGLESVLAHLTAGLAARGHVVRLISLFGENPAERCLPFEELARHGVEVVDVRVPPRSYSAERRRLHRFFSQTAGTVAHSHGYHADFVTLGAARAAGVPAVSTVHGVTGGGMKNRLYEWFGWRVLRRFDGVVAVSRPLQSRLTAVGIAPDRQALIPNAYAHSTASLDRAAARAELGLAPDALVVGWVGRLTREKGPDQFIEAIGRCSRPVVASILGDGPMRPGLEAEARTLGITDRVRWHGVVPEARRLLSAFDVLALSSRTEGTPMVVLEAMAAGVPLICTAVGGVPDVVSDAEAVLIPAGHSDLLAHAIDNVFAAPDSARERAVAARQRVTAAYGLDAWVDQYEALYRRLGAGGPKRRGRAVA
jgi:glycosyltransferase involved in cell wall biosynthesis